MRSYQQNFREIFLVIFQDPFELNLNVTRNMPEKGVNILKTYFREDGTKIIAPWGNPRPIKKDI